MTDLMSLRANLGLVIRGEVGALRDFYGSLQELLAKEPEVQLVHKAFSASKLWIREDVLNVDKDQSS